MIAGGPSKTLIQHIPNTYMPTAGLLH